MLGLANASSGLLAKMGSVLHGKAEGVPPTASTPDLFSYCFYVDFKGQSAQVEVGGSSLVSEVYDKVLAGLGDKLRKDALERVLFYKDTAIYLPNLRRVDSFLLNPDVGDIIELDLKKKDKKAIPMAVLCDGKTETVEINPNTTVQGVIQLLPRKTPDDEFLTLFNKKGKLEWQAKVATLLKKDETLEAKLDADLKAMGGSVSSKDRKKNNRKSMQPLRKPLSASSSSPSITPAGSSPATPAPTPSGSLKDKKALERLISNRPTEADLKKKNIIVDYKSDVKAAAPAAIDANAALTLQLRLFVELGTYIKQHLDLVGLFRVSGDVEEVKQFYQSMWGKINWAATANDPHVATSALKLYLRKQADPLIPFANYQEFMAAQKTNDEHEQIAAMKAAIAKLPEPNASILHYLIHFLTLVAEHEPSNKMNPINIGIVFGPTIMWDPKPDVMDYSSTGYQSSLVTNMIDHYNDLWTTPPPDGGFSAHLDITDSHSDSGSQAAPSPGSSYSPKGFASPLEHASMDIPPLLTKLSSPNLMVRPVPSSPAGGPPKRGSPKLPPGGPPKLPPGGPPSSGGISPSSSGSNISITPSPNGPHPAINAADLLQTRASFRKSLPPNAIAAMTGAPSPSGGANLSSVSEAGTTSTATGSHVPIRPSPPSVPANPLPSKARRISASIGTRYDSQLTMVQEEIRDNIMLGTCPTATSLTANMDELRAHLATLSHADLVNHMSILLAAIGGRTPTSS